MRNIWLICYDISNTKRRNKVHKALKGFGTALQLSIFRCALTPAEKLMLRDRLWNKLNEKEDRLLLVDLGPESGTALESMESWGLPVEPTIDSDEPMVF